MNKDSVITAEQLENTAPDTERTVHRNNNEGLRLRIYNIGPNTGSETRIQTYNRVFGHYTLDFEGSSRIYLDELINGLCQEYNTVRNSESNGCSYELTVEVRDDIESTDVEINSDHIEIRVDAEDDYASSFDELFDTIEDEVISQNL